MFSYGYLDMDTPAFADQQNIYSSSLCGHWMPSRRLAKSDDW